MTHAQLRRLVVVGDAGTGKTCMIRAFIDGGCTGEPIPTVFDHQTVNKEVDNTQVFLEIRDTSGSEDYDKLRTLSYPNVEVIIMCFAIDNATSLNSIMDKWYSELRHHCPMCPIMLVGTKSDSRNDQQMILRLASRKQAVLRPEQGRNIKDRIGALLYLECSAKNNVGIQEVFKHAMLLRGTNKTSTRKCCLL